MKSILKSKVMMVVICLVSVITLLMIPNLVFAVDAVDSAQGSIQPRWSCIYVCENGIDYANDISQGIKIMGATQTYDGYYAEVEVQLEKYTTSGIWVNVPTYNWREYSESCWAEVFEDNISVTPGTYRCSLVHSAYDEDGFLLESVSFQTRELTVTGN